MMNNTAKGFDTRYSNHYERRDYYIIMLIVQQIKLFLDPYLIKCLHSSAKTFYSLRMYECIIVSAKSD